MAPPLPHPLPSRPPPAMQPAPPRPPPPPGSSMAAFTRSGAHLESIGHPPLSPIPPVPAFALSASATGSHSPAPFSRPVTSASASGSSPALANNSRVTIPAAAGPHDIGATPLPWSKPLQSTEVTTTAQLIELGEGWVVRYRAWKAPALFYESISTGDESQHVESRNGDEPDYFAWDPLAPSSSRRWTGPARKLSNQAPLSGKESGAAPPPTKKLKRTGSSRSVAGSAMDELLVEGLAGSTTAGGGQPAPSLGTPLGSPLLMLPGAGGPSTVPARLPAALKASAVDLHASSSSSSTTASYLDAGPSTAPSDPSDPAVARPSESDPRPSSTARIRAHLARMRASTPSDPVLLAQAHLAERCAHAREDGGDRLSLFSWVGTKLVEVGGPGSRAQTPPKGADREKGKGKAREGEASADGHKRERSQDRAKGGRSEEPDMEGTREGEGRTLWVFAVVRGGEMKADAARLDDLVFTGLESFASGEFTHASLYPALYPPASAGDSVSTNAYASPLSLPANAYPSALAISDSLVSIPLIAQPQEAQTPLQAAFEAFRGAVASTVLDEVAQQPVAGTRCVRLGSTVLFLPLPSPSRFTPLSPRPALQLALRPIAVNRSSLHLHSEISQLAVTLVDGEGQLEPGTRVRLAPLDLGATFVRNVRLSAARRAQLDAEWAPHLAQAERAAMAEDQRESYVLCELDVPATARINDAERIELLWPRTLVLRDGEWPVKKREEPLPPAETSPAGPSPGGLDVLNTPSSAKENIQPAPFALLGLRAARTPWRSHLAGQLLRGRGSLRRRDSDGAGGFRSPIKRRTGEVWQWIGEEGKRREEEKENAARREAEKDARMKEAVETTAVPPPAAHATPKDEEKSIVTAGAVPAAAPLNMRTPMSLGASSTEAPSPAELYASLHPPQAAPSSSQAPPSTNAAVEQPHDTLSGLDLDFGLGMYPSPAEPGLSLAPAPAVTTVSTSAPMSTLEAAFSEFDWGDGTFGTSGIGGGKGPDAAGERSNEGSNGGGFDDGMMLGLTDDDFSFFDAPTPGPVTSLALSMAPPPPLAAETGDLDYSTLPPVSTMHDALSLFSSAPNDAPGATVSATAFDTDPILATTTSPEFPEGPSPALPFSFGDFDSLTPNALDLASGSPNGPALAALPFSPVVLPTVEGTPASLGLAVHSPRPASFSPVIAANEPETRRSSRSHGVAAFEPVSFDATHAALDGKYDPRRGKFGLPSPDSDQEGRALLPVGAYKGTRSWYTTVCDPRIALAERLRRHHLGAGKLSTSKTFRTGGGDAKADAVPPQRAWIRRRLGAVLGLEGLAQEDSTPSTMQPTVEDSQSEMSSDDSDGDDMMDADGLSWAGGEADDEPHDLDDDMVLHSAFGATVLGAALYLKNDVSSSVTSPDGQPPPDGIKPDPARDLTFHVVTEHLMHHPDLRQATLAFSARSHHTKAPVTCQALATVSDALATVCGHLSPSPLFADHTALVPLVQEASPAFLLRTQQCIVETSCAAIDFWRPMGFEPLPGAKSVTAFVVYEDTGSEMHEIVREWIRAIGSTYEGLRLGSHTPGTVSASPTFAGVQDGLVPVPRGLLSTGQPREELKLLYTALSDTSKTSQNTVVYLIAPLDESPLSHGSPLASIIHQVGKSRHGASAVNMLPCTVPLSSLTGGGRSASSSSGTGRLARLAFSVYDQLQVPVERLRFPLPETFPSARPPSLAPLGPAVRPFAAPAIHIAPAPSSRGAQFSLSWPPMALAVEDRHRMLHVCYSSRPMGASSGQECLVVATVDEKGESWKVAPRIVKAPAGPLADVQRVRVVWSFVKSLVDSVDLEWRIVVCKLGEPTGLEAKTWDSLLKEYLAVVRRPLHVTFACAELDPALALLPRRALQRRGSTTSVGSDSVHGQEGSVASIPSSSSTGGDGKTTVLDASPTIFTFTPAEPVSLGTVPFSPAASTYFLHVPRGSSHAHANPDLAAAGAGESSTASTSSLPSSASSSYALHVFLSHVSRTSTYQATLGALVSDVRRSFVALAALGRVRWGTSGRVAWHLEATALALRLAEQVSC